MNKYDGNQKPDLSYRLSPRVIIGACALLTAFTAGALLKDYAFDSGYADANSRSNRKAMKLERKIERLRVDRGFAVRENDAAEIDKIDANIGRITTKLDEANNKKTLGRIETRASVFLNTNDFENAKESVEEYSNKLSEFGYAGKKNPQTYTLNKLNKGLKELERTRNVRQTLDNVLQGRTNIVEYKLTPEVVVYSLNGGMARYNEIRLKDGRLVFMASKEVRRLESDIAEIDSWFERNKKALQRGTDKSISRRATENGNKRKGLTEQLSEKAREEHEVDFGQTKVKDKQVTAKDITNHAGETLAKIFTVGSENGTEIIAIVKGMAASVPQVNMKDKPVKRIND